MSRLRALRTLAVVAIVALLATPAPVAAQASGQTTISITLPDIVILHYFAVVDVGITKNALGNFLVGAAGDSSVDDGPASPAAGGFTQDLAIVPSSLNSPAAAVLTLQNSWAVRALSLAGATDTQVSIVIDTAALAGPATSSMTITNAIVDDANGNSGATIQFPAPGLSNPEVGDVALTIDMTAATQAGAYTGGQYTITAQNI